MSGQLKDNSAKAVEWEGNVFVELPIGHYQLEVNAKNFEKFLQQGISLNVNQFVSVNIRLRVGSDTQVVEVKADAALVQDTVSSLGETVLQRQILDLPLDGRNFSQLGTLQPGVVPLTPGLLEAGGPALGRMKPTRSTVNARSLTIS